MLLTESDKNHKTLPKLSSQDARPCGEIESPLRGVSMRDAELDLITLYAYCDKNHAESREVWRNFLSYLLPVIFQMDGDELGQLLDEAMTQDVEKVLKGAKRSPADILREISGELAHALELDREFGLAAFVDGEFPTRVYPVKRKKIRDGNVEASKWIIQFSRIQKDPELEARLAEWKTKLDDLLEIDDGLQESA